VYRLTTIIDSSGERDQFTIAWEDLGRRFRDMSRASTEAKDLEIQQLHIQLQDKVHNIESIEAEMRTTSEKHAASMQILQETDQENSATISELRSLLAEKDSEITILKERINTVEKEVEEVRGNVVSFIISKLCLTTLQVDEARENCRVSCSES
jgi:predicted RNase H-like nuclease (RuvC/YqgF family)